MKKIYKGDANFILNAMLNEINEYIVLVDKEGRIIALSLAYAKFLGVDRASIMGKHVTEVIENTRLHIVLKTGKEEIGAPHRIKGQNLISTRIPIREGNEVVGAFGRIMFKTVGDLNEMYHRISNLEKELNFYESNFDKMNVAKYSIDDIIGESEYIKKLKETIKKLAYSNSNVLILGESGTGKELIAHAIHNQCWGDGRPLVCVNCAAIPDELMESELFGYEEGSFTGAKKGGKIGLFQAANGGTLFLDEIGEMPIRMQAKLLRVLQDKKVKKIGSNVPEAVNVRIIAATNRDLLQMIDEGKFREDLFFRLNVISVSIPPLRKRVEDIPLLANALLEKMSRIPYINAKSISAEAMEYLKKHDWPGNVRELENVIERASNYVDGSGIINVQHLPTSISKIDIMPIDKTLKELMEETERNCVINALLSTNWKKSAAAKVLNISRTALYEKIEKYNIQME